MFNIGKIIMDIFNDLLSKIVLDVFSSFLTYINTKIYFHIRETFTHSTFLDRDPEIFRHVLSFFRTGNR